MSTRVNVWFNAHESKKLRGKCEDCGLSPYAYIKELTLKDLYENVRKEGRLEKSGIGNSRGETKASESRLDDGTRQTEELPPFLAGT